MDKETNEPSSITSNPFSVLFNTHNENDDTKETQTRSPRTQEDLLRNSKIRTSSLSSAFSAVPPSEQRNKDGDGQQSQTIEEGDERERPESPSLITIIGQSNLPNGGPRSPDPFAAVLEEETQIRYLPTYSEIEAELSRAHFSLEVQKKAVSDLRRENNRKRNEIAELKEQMRILRTETGMVQFFRQVHENQVLMEKLELSESNRKSIETKLAVCLKEKDLLEKQYSKEIERLSENFSNQLREYKETMENMSMALHIEKQKNEKLNLQIIEYQQEKQQQQNTIFKNEDAEFDLTRKKMRQSDSINDQMRACITCGTHKIDSVLVPCGHFVCSEKICIERNKSTCSLCGSGTHGRRSVTSFNKSSFVTLPNGFNGTIENKV